MNLIGDNLLNHVDVIQWQLISSVELFFFFTLVHKFKCAQIQPYKLFGQHDFLRQQLDVLYPSPSFVVFTHKTKAYMYLRWLLNVSALFVYRASGRKHDQRTAPYMLATRHLQVR